MSQPMNMMGGPMPNIATPNSKPGYDTAKMLHTYIYDYFLKNGHYDVARAVLKGADIDLKPSTKQSPGSKNINGVNDSMDTESKEDKRPDDLPLAEVPPVSDGSFLFDWWHQFWECYQAQRGNANAQAAKYLTNVQARITNASERQRLMRVDPQMQANMGMRPGMMPPGMPSQAEMAKKMGLPPGRQPTAQQMQQMHNVMRMQQMQMHQTAMQREGSTTDQRPASPGGGGGDNAPSPKRQRLDGSFSGGMPMGPMGRGQPQGMPGQQMGNPKAMQQVYAQAMRQQAQSAMDSDVNKGLMANGVPMPQDPNAEFFNRPGGMPGQGPQNANSNHALQDYQMQLMLLEQQNKKRLLMARQEQDNMTNGPNGPVPGGPGPGPGGPGQPQPFAPAMSPSNSRAGPSPGPNEQMRRGTPKMAPGVVPSPTADGGMPGRASPAPGQFDPNMNPAMFPMGMMKGGPNGQPMMQPPSSHPAFTQQQQMEMFRQQQARNGAAQMANGAYMPQSGPNMMGNQPPQQPNMTPHQRNAAMPPPPAPAPGDGPRGGTQPSSPSQNQAPPTPSQANKPNAKAKKDGKASAKGNKKAAGATPVESEQPPTPTPAPPITPQPSQAFPPKPGQPPNQQQPPQQNGQPNMSGQQNQGGDMGVMGAPFGGMDDESFNMGLDFQMNGPDVLESFDFDSFLTNDASADNFSFDPSGMNFGTDGGLEAGGDL